jgi:hypothetical protein
MPLLLLLVGRECLVSSQTAFMQLRPRHGHSHAWHLASNMHSNLVNTRGRPRATISLAQVTAEVATTIMALKTGFAGGLTGSSSLIMMATSPGGITSHFSRMYDPSATTLLPTIDTTKVAVGSEEWQQVRCLYV